MIIADLEISFFLAEHDHEGKNEGSRSICSIFDAAPRSRKRKMALTSYKCFKKIKRDLSLFSLWVAANEIEFLYISVSWRREDNFILFFVLLNSGACLSPSEFSYFRSSDANFSILR